MSKTSFMDHIRDAAKNGQDFSEPPAVANIWSAVYVTPRGDAAVLEFIEQSERMVTTADSLVKSIQPSFPPWVFNRVGHSPYGFGIRETGWFSLVCHLARLYEDSYSFACWQTFNWDSPWEAIPKDGFREHEKFITHWDELKPDLPSGTYALMPATDARIASIEAIDSLVALVDASRVSERQHPEPQAEHRTDLDEAHLAMCMEALPRHSITEAVVPLADALETRGTRQETPKKSSFTRKTGRLYRKIVKAGNGMEHGAKGKRKKLAETFKDEIVELAPGADPVIFVNRAFAYLFRHRSKSRRH